MPRFTADVSACKGTLSIKIYTGSVTPSTRHAQRELATATANIASELEHLLAQATDASLDGFAIERTKMYEGVIMVSYPDTGDGASDIATELGIEACSNAVPGIEPV